MLNFEVGTRFITKGGWDAVCCDATTVYHARDGGKLYTHDTKGKVTSQTVGSDYDLEFQLVKIK